MALTEKQKNDIYLALKKAEDSLFHLLNEKTSLVDFSVEYSTEIDVHSFGETDKNLLLTTNLMKDVKGVSYWYMTRKDALYIEKKGLSHNLDDSKAGATEMEHEFLLESDNILAASSIALLADSTKLKIIGGPPNLKEVNDAEFTEIIKKAKKLKKLNLCVNASLSNDNFKTKYLWYFNKESLFPSVDK